MSIETGDLVPRIYSGFRGVDFRGEEISLVRSPDSLNVWKDYKETESIRTRPGMALVTAFDSTIFGVFFFKGVLLVHAGSRLYRVENGAQTVIFEGVSERKSNAFVYNGVWYFKDGKQYLQYDGENIGEVAGYIPTTSIGRKPAGGGTVHEDVNMISPYRKNTFLADGKSTEFYLDVFNLDEELPLVTVNDQEVTAFAVDYADGKITFASAPSEPLTDGQDNVVIQFKKTIATYRKNILGCTLLQVFDNRVFVSGNPENPNFLWHSSLDDPTYFSDLDYYREGMDEAGIKGLVAGNNALWVFREPSEANTNVFYHTPTIDSEYGKIYPSSHSSVTTGCVGAAVNFNDDIVFFSERGMEGISGDITTEQVVEHRSSLVDRKLISEENYGNMITAEWEGYLLVFIGDKVYLADSRTAFTYEDHMEYEWFYWQLSRNVTAVAVYRGILYLGAEGGVYTLTDLSGGIESYWTTPKDKFKVPHKLKTTNKRGCVVEATGDITLYAKTEDTEFEMIGTYESITDYFVARIKKKKFKDIQLKFYSDTRFSLETASLECFVGAYIKR